MRRAIISKVFVLMAPIVLDIIVLVFFLLINDGISYLVTASRRE
jgi:hypothetical protein